MTSWDTNWLLRHLLEDDVHQLAIVREHLEACEKKHIRIFLTLLVMVEAGWVLRGKMNKKDVLDTLDEVIEDRRFQVESEEAFREAIRRSRKNGDMSDHLIAHAASTTHALPVYSFDKNLSSFKDFKVL